MNSNDYRFLPHRDLLYTRREVLIFLNKWNSIGLCDEMINVTFNRDFYNEDQKDVIKMINMNRDHKNLIIACVPSFKTLDTQIKNLCKIRLTVVRRGLAIIQTPNRTIYVADKWDEATNEKIEREWIKKGKIHPQYSRLNTFRGVLKFPPLSEKDEIKYQAIKNEKRNIIAKEQMGIDVEDEKKDVVDIAIDMLLNHKVKNSSVLDGLALSDNRDTKNFKATLRSKLRRLNKPDKLTLYYWDKARTAEEFRNVHTQNLIKSIKA
jgi:hypothetical protein